MVWVVVRIEGCEGRAMERNVREVVVVVVAVLVIERVGC